MNCRKLLVLCSLLGSAMLFAQEGNVIPNPSFEEPLGESWQVPAWVWKSPQGKGYFCAEIDKTVSQGAVGNCSLKFEPKGEKRNTWLPMMPGNNPTVKLPAGVKEVTLSMWIKSVRDASVKGNCARLEFIATFQGKGKKPKRFTLITPWERTVPKWEKFSQNIKVPVGYDSVSFLLKFSGNKFPIVMWVDNLYLGPKVQEEVAPVKQAEKEAHLIRAVHNARHDGIYYPGEKINYELHFRNLKNPGKQAVLSWVARDFDEKELAKGKTDITLERRVDFTLPLPADYKGFYTVRMEVFSDGKLLDGGLYSGMVIDKQDKIDPFFSTRGCRSYEKHVRMGFGPRVMLPGSSMTWYLETAPGKYAFGPKDQVVEAAMKEGYKDFYCHTNFSVGIIPQYKRKDYEARIRKGENPFTEKDFEDYRMFFRAVFQHYGKNVSSWRVPDEIMLVRLNPVGKLGVELYHKFCRIFYEEMKKANPDAVLYAGGAMFGEAKYQDLKAQVWDKIQDCVDGLCVDAYTQGASIGVGQNFLGPEQLKLRETYLRTFKATGCKKFVNEETGSAIQRDLPLNHELLKYYAIVNARIITVCKSLDQVSAWTHFLIEDSEAAWNGNFDYAAWKNYNPRPHAYTLALVQRELAYAVHGIEVKPHADIYAYVFERRGKTLLAIWGMSKEGIDAKIKMPSSWKGRSVIGQEVSGKKGECSFKLTDRPYYLELSASQEDVVKAVSNGKYAVPEAKLTINRQSGKVVNVYVENKTQKELTAKVSLNGRSAKSVTVPPMSEKSVGFEQTLCKELKASATVNGVNYQTIKNDEIFLVERLAKAPAMDGTLKGFESVKPLIFDKSDVLQPIDAGAWGYWTGPKDLSAKLYLAYDQNYFYIAADVLDDVHISRHSDGMIWNQDCVQYAFDTENDTFDPAKSKGGFNPDDREFCMALTPKGPQNYCYTAPLGMAHKPVADKINITHKDGRTVYEARIPWKYFGKLGPASGSIFGFNVIFFDIDQKLGAIPYRMELSSGIADGKSPACFKRFMLK